jgi:hypothetical protein
VPERLHEVALTLEEVDKILSVCGSQALLVGGQALAFWAARYGIKPVGALSTNVTSDVDFVGSAQVAEKLGKALNWNIWLPKMEDATPQTAKVSTSIRGGGVKQVDFLRTIVGLDTDWIQARAVEATLPSGAMIRILHPLDVLESRLRNLQILPSKRDGAGIAQAELAIAVARKFLESLIESGEDTRTILDAVERVLQIALDKPLANVAADFGLNPLISVPWSKVDVPDFQAKRWPQVLAAAAELRRKSAVRKARRAASGKDKTS